MDLQKKDHQLYTQNGVLNMLDRNIKVKRAPQRWHIDGMAEPGGFDVIITYEDRVYDSVVNGRNYLDQSLMEKKLNLFFIKKDFLKRGSRSFTTVRVINISTKDNHSAAKQAGQQTLFLVAKVWKKKQN